MPMQDLEAVEAELSLWYEARRAAALGKSYTLSTSVGSRTLTPQDLPAIEDQIRRLERRVTMPAGRAGHNFAVANFNHE